MTTLRIPAKTAASAVTAVATVLLAAWATPANAISATGTFNWVSAKSKRCVDADLGTIRSNGTRVQLWDCNRQSQQHWISYTDGRIRSSKSKKCLDADLNTINRNGTRLQLWDCNGSLQQRWTIAPGAVRGTHRIISRHSGRCVDADLGTIRSNGTRMQLWDCNSQAQQDWRTLYY